jgi:hypothetical protein
VHTISFPLMVFYSPTLFTPTRQRQGARESAVCSFCGASFLGGACCLRSLVPCICHFIGRKSLRQWNKGAKACRQCKGLSGWGPPSCKAHAWHTPAPSQLALHTNTPHQIHNQPLCKTRKLNCKQTMGDKRQRKKSISKWDLGAAQLSGPVPTFIV